MVGVSGADREQVVATLQRRAVLGLLSDHELSDGIQRARAARTWEDLDGILRDLSPAADDRSSTSSTSSTSSSSSSSSTSSAPWASPGATPSSAPWARPGATSSGTHDGPGTGASALPGPSAGAGHPPGSGPGSTPAGGPWGLPAPPPGLGGRRTGPRWWLQPNTVISVGVLSAIVISTALASIGGSGEVGPAVDPVEVPETVPPLPLPATTDHVVPVPTTAHRSNPVPTILTREPVILRFGEERGEIEPGLYANDADLDCQWERRDAFGTMMVEGAAPHVLVEMRGNEELFSEGCGTWHLYVPPVEPANGFGDGDWLVGEDVAAGTYRSSPAAADPDLCTWEVGSGFLHELREVMGTGFPNGPADVQLVAGRGSPPRSAAPGPWTADLPATEAGLGLQAAAAIRRSIRRTTSRWPPLPMTSAR